MEEKIIFPKLLHHFLVQGSIIRPWLTEYFIISIGSSKELIWSVLWSLFYMRNPQLVDAKVPIKAYEVVPHGTNPDIEVEMANVGNLRQEIELISTTNL